MKQTKKGIVLLCLMVLTIGFTTSCSKMDVGYLRTAGASFTPDSINAFHNIDPTSDRAVNNLPFVSTRIQGVAGTNPVNFELAGAGAALPEALPGGRNLGGGWSGRCLVESGETAAEWQIPAVPQSV